MNGWLQKEAKRGSVVRQELVSGVPAALLDVRPGMSVLDVCAAPGSKTSQYAAGREKGASLSLQLANLAMKCVKESVGASREW